MIGSGAAQQPEETGASGPDSPSLRRAHAEAFDELQATMAGRHLQVFPELLEFPMRLGVDTLLTASLRNASPSYIAFKVKTTATERYRVRPNIGVVAPGETAHVKLVLVAQTDFAPDLQHCRDRFLVQSLPILPGQQPDSTAFKAQKFKVQDHKLRVSITQVHNAQNLIGDSAAGGKGLRPVASPLEKEIRSSLLAIAEEQGLDGHRSCLTKFSELLLLNGVISTQQMGVALDLVEALFEPEEEPEHMEELNRSVHTWIEESEHSGAGSDDGLSSPSAAGMSAASSSFATGPDRPPPPMISRSQLATIVSGVPTAADVFPSPPTARGNGGGAAPQRSPIAVRRAVDPATAKPQDLFPSPPATPTGDARQNGTLGREDSDPAAPNGPHTPATAGSDYNPPPLRRVEDAYAAAPDSVVANASTSAVASDTRALRTPPASPPQGGSVGSGGLKRNSADDGSSRSDILLDLLPAKVSATSSTSSFTGGDRPVPESPARNLAAMLRSTLRNPGPSGQKLREAFTQGASPDRRPGSADWEARESFSATAPPRHTIEGVAEA